MRQSVTRLFLRSHLILQSENRGTFATGRGEDAHKVRLLDADAIDLEDASPGYRYLHDRITRKDMDINYMIEEEEKAHDA